jgi:hypothetical protein
MASISLALRHNSRQRIAPFAMLFISMCDHARGPTCAAAALARLAHIAFDGIHAAILITSHHDIAVPPDSLAAPRQPH